MYIQKKEEFFEEFFHDIGSTLEDLCQSGFHTVHDNTLQELQEKGETAARCGMQHVSELLLSLHKELSQSRHRIFPTDPENQNDFSCKDGTISLPVKYYAELIKCIELGKEKTAYDKGKNYYLSK